MIRFPPYAFVATYTAPTGSSFAPPLPRANAGVDTDAASTDATSMAIGTTRRETANRSWSPSRLRDSLAATLMTVPFRKGSASFASSSRLPFVARVARSDKLCTRRPVWGRVSGGVVTFARHPRIPDGYWPRGRGQRFGRLGRFDVKGQLVDGHNGCVS